MGLILEAIGSALGYALIGLVVALAIKAFRRNRPFPKWPVIAFAILGFVVRIGLGSVYSA